MIFIFWFYLIINNSACRVRKAVLFSSKLKFKLTDTTTLWLTTDRNLQLQSEVNVSQPKLNKNTVQCLKPIHIPARIFIKEKLQMNHVNIG